MKEPFVSFAISSKNSKELIFRSSESAPSRLNEKMWTFGRLLAFEIAEFTLSR